jgi:DNA-binding NarL/FixJ family response regulator
MVAVAVLALDRALCRRLEQSLHNEQGIVLAGIVDSQSALFALIAKRSVDIVLIHTQPGEQFTDWAASQRKIPWAVLVDEPDHALILTALQHGASAVLLRSAGLKEIVSAIEAVSQGLVVLEQKVIGVLFDANMSSDELLNRETERQNPLTPRELEVLNTIADGASNKAIARRLGISFHTVKFHVAAILEKLDADSRTEAVIKAAQLGIVML